MNKAQKIRAIWGFAGLFIALLVLLLANIVLGSVNVSPSAAFSALLSGESDFSYIVRNLRLPRIIAAVVLGGALALSGYLLQVFFANPIAGPFILGISSGAKLSITLTLIVLLSRGIAAGSAVLIAAAFLGAMTSMGFVLLISTKVKNMSILIICGVMIGYICSSVCDFLLTFADEANIVNLHNWSLGSFSGITWSNVAFMSVLVCAALIAAFLLVKPISAYGLGEVYAKNMGVNLRVFRIVLILLSSILSACVTAFAGPVSFVGVAVPHIVRSVFKTSKPLCLVPACFLCGVVFCLFCDLIARCAFSPTELSISSVTAVFGAPIVIIVMLRRQKKGV